MIRAIYQCAKCCSASIAAAFVLLVSGCDDSSVDQEALPDQRQEGGDRNDRSSDARQPGAIRLISEQGEYSVIAVPGTKQNGDRLEVAYLVRGQNGDFFDSGWRKAVHIKEGFIPEGFVRFLEVQPGLVELEINGSKEVFSIDGRSQPR